MFHILKGDTTAWDEGQLPNLAQALIRFKFIKWLLLALFYTFSYHSSIEWVQLHHKSSLHYFRKSNPK